MTHCCDAKPSSDPTGTGRIRNGWRIEVRRHLAAAEARIKNVVRANEGQVLEQAYSSLLNSQLGTNWSQPYLARAYRKGLDDAARLVKRPSQQVFLVEDYNKVAEAADRVVKAFGLVTGDLARELAAKVPAAEDQNQAIRVVAARVRAVGLLRGQAVASVNTIQAHAEGTLAMYRRAGVKQVGVLPETFPRRGATTDAIRRGPRGRFASREALLAVWKTAEDEDVCPACDAMAGKVFDLDEAEGMIPLHPNCRCMWIPYLDNPLETYSELIRQGVNPEEL